MASGANNRTLRKPEIRLWRIVVSTSTSSSATTIATGPRARALRPLVRKYASDEYCICLSGLQTVARSFARTPPRGKRCGARRWPVCPARHVEEALHQDLWLSDERL